MTVETTNANIYQQHSFITPANMISAGWQGHFWLARSANRFRLKKRPHAKGHDMYFGVDYHPEQWVYPYRGTSANPEGAWQRDTDLMREAGVNVVRIGEFTWGVCESEEGKYNFDWLLRVMDIMKKAGIK